MEIIELKRRLAQGRTSKGYPAELRAEAVRYANGQRAAGVRPVRIAEELGVLDQTVRYWQKLARQGNKRTPTNKLVPVSVAELPVRQDGLIVECGPLRIRGLDLVGVVSLLRSLG